MARKLSAYNKHVQREMKAGKTMKQAAASWRSRGTSRSTSTTTRKKKTMAKKKKKTSTRRGKKLLGNVGLKGIISGGGLLVLADMLIPSNVGGAFNPALKVIGAGAAAKATGLSGASLIGTGAMMGGAALLSQVLRGQMPSLGGGGSSGGYDY